jgi:hypothetical protein
MIENILFRKKKSHLVTLNNGQYSSQVDFVLTKRDKKPNSIDYKIIPDKCVILQNKLVVTDFYFHIHV